MERFYGLMPSEEVEQEKTLTDEYGLNILLQAGPHGWSIIWQDYSFDFEDIDGTTEENMQRATDFYNHKINENNNEDTIDK